MNCFEENALIYLLKHTQGVRFMETLNPEFFDVVIGKQVCKSIHKDELFRIMLKVFEVK